MDLIIDANIVFATLIKEGITTEIIAEEEIHLFAPEFLFDEIFKHLGEIVKKTNRTPKELEAAFDLLKEKITFVPLKEFEFFLEEAEKICPDPGDAPYFALALKLKIPIWSNDRDLKEKQKLVLVYSTNDLLGDQYTR